MKEKIFLLSRIPVEFFSSDRYDLIYWNSLFNGSYPLNKYLKIADNEPFPRNSSFTVRIILGFLINFKGTIIFTTPGTHSEHRTILSLLIKRGVNFLELHTGDNKNVKIEEIFAKLRNFTNTDEKELTDNFNKNLKLRKSLYKRIKNNELSGRTMQLASLNLAENLSPEYLKRGKKNFKKKILLMGNPVTTSLINHIEKRGYLISLTLESLYEIFLIKEGMKDCYHNFPFPSRSISFLVSKMKEIVVDMEISGIIYLMVPLSHEYLEYELFRKSMNFPVLPLEVSSPDKIDRRTSLRIDSFLEILEKKQ